MAVVRTVINVVCAERAGEKLKEKRGFVGGPSAGVKKSSLWHGQFQFFGYPFKRVIPGNFLVMGIARLAEKGTDDSSGIF